MEKFPWRRVVLYVFSTFCASLAFSNPLVFAQTGETDVAQSMGVGMKSRFASGATPIAIERTKIIPGTPMSVNSTMSNILTSSSGSSFGGILARYDTSNFGKFFGTGTLPTHSTLSNARVDALNALDQGDNEVENAEAVDRMYPPRLSIDFDEFPTRVECLSSPENLDKLRSTLSSQIDNVLSRCDFDRGREKIRVENVGTRIYLRGVVKSRRTSVLLENVLSINFGGDAVVNELIVENNEEEPVDLFGRSTSAK